MLIKKKRDQTDSPEIPDSGETREIPQPPFGGNEVAARRRQMYRQHRKGGRDKRMFEYSEKPTDSQDEQKKPMNNQPW